ncbi:PREDICTED: uncharacterized threonine-rich GPI-anchored glycoprotein PJ4664.02-like isoform X2 [Amphimedon queenslandica]|uniref:Fibronectin type-III domain-containing protein n=1 Tax=Amphimedon queenslandica TaxID=400682 RepID=A0A1X7TW03_AMPQE|nr:PREDICTED: uncharacterized threonine-rich GPI-anchored glycoprotein PJ4664.02-like isoform X2 [Amphimedon queenslandica]|eukprot:XP_019857357.1 PREDICTED: uncharacterized threonine-rich GPI-anchored glycoprotein PJ4664.02-like isoform X2 [Amphimedon queenslandica]
MAVSFAAPVAVLTILGQICFSGASIFTIVPVTQYAYINDTVTFECARSNRLTQIDLVFVTYPPVIGLVSLLSLLNGKKVMLLKLTATSEINGTSVICTTQRLIGAPIATPPAYLYVQGPPDSVGNLTGYQLDSCCMFISWYPPFTLPGLTVQYIISVGTDQQYLNDSITNYTYCPINPTNKQYLFNITTTNKAGNGSTSNITVGFQSTNVQLYVTDKEKGKVNWTFRFNVSVHQFCNNASLINITLKGCTKDNCYSTTNVSISNSSYNNIISLAVQFPSNKTLNTNATLYYQNGVTVQSNTIIISTHDLQKFTLINITSNSVCLQFQYINGSTPNSDVILFTDNMNYTESYLISPDNQFTFIQCIDDIPAGNNLRLYACELATIKNCESNPLAVITDINITDDFTSSVLMSSVHSSLVSLTSTVLTTPSMMSVPLIMSASPIPTTSPVSTTLTLTIATNSIILATSSSIATTSSMTSLLTRMPTLSVPISLIMSEFETFPSSVLVASLIPTASSVPASSSASTISLVSTTGTSIVPASSSSIINDTIDTPASSSASTISLVSTTSIVPASSTFIISSTTDTPIISASTIIPTSRLTSTLVTGISTTSSITLLFLTSSSSSIHSSFLSLSSVSSLSNTSSQTSSFITSSSPDLSFIAPSFTSSSPSIIELGSGISISLLIIIIVVIVIVVVAATVRFKKRRGRIEVINNIKEK